jgi:hypothetical protein
MLPGVEIFVLYVDGVPAGYGEFEKQVEVNQFSSS